MDKYGEHMEFCQIQLNYLDWTLQNAAAKVELLNKKNIPIWVMENLWYPKKRWDILLRQMEMTV